MHTRRSALLLAAALTVTVVTGAFAAAGILHRPAAAAPAPVVRVSPQPAALPAATWADD